MNFFWEHGGAIICKILYNSAFTTLSIIISDDGGNFASWYIKIITPKKNRFLFCWKITFVALKISFHALCRFQKRISRYTIARLFLFAVYVNSHFCWCRWHIDIFWCIVVAFIFISRLFCRRSRMSKLNCNYDSCTPFYTKTSSFVTCFCALYFFVLSYLKVYIY